MPDQLPIACSLGASELPQRLAEMAALGDAALVDVRVQRRRAELRFGPAAAGVRQRVEALVPRSPAAARS